MNGFYVTDTRSNAIQNTTDEKFNKLQSTNISTASKTDDTSRNKKSNENELLTKQNTSTSCEIDDVDSASTAVKPVITSETERFSSLEERIR